MNLRNLLTLSLLLLMSATLCAQTPNAQHEKIKQQAEAASQKGDYQKAIELATAVIQQNKNDDVAYYLRASSEVELGLKKGDIQMVRTGIADAREAIRLKKTNNVMYHLPYLYGMTQLSVLEKKPEHANVAVQVANDAAKRPGISRADKANIVYQRGLAHATLGKTDEAIADYEEVIELVPTHAGALLTVADMYVSTKQTDKALASFNRAAKVLPKNPLVHNNKGMFLQQQGKAQEAVNAFTEAMRADPKFTMAYTNRGYTLLKSGNAKDAETDFTSSIRLTPQQSLAYSLRGTARLKLGKTAEAISDHQQVINQNPKNPIAHADIGFAYFFTKQYDKAADSFSTALTLGKHSRHLHPWRYMSLVLAGKEKEATLAYSSIVKKEAKGRDWIDTLLAYVSGNASEADLLAATKNKELKLQTDRTCEANYFIGIKRIAAGKKDEAAKFFKQAVASQSRHLSAFRGAEFGLK